MYVPKSLSQNIYAAILYEIKATKHIEAFIQSELSAALYQQEHTSLIKTYFFPEHQQNLNNELD